MDPKRRGTGYREEVNNPPRADDDEDGMHSEDRFIGKVKSGTSGNPTWRTKQNRLAGSAESGTYHFSKYVERYFSILEK